MNISLNWLTDYVDVAAMPTAELAELCTHIGMYCDGIDQTDADVVFDMEVTSNRPDWLGHIGVAREIAAAASLPLELPDLAGLPTTAPPAAELTGVEVLDPDLCPRYTARVIRGVAIGPSPRWLVERLEAVGLRSVNNVVDVTNYVLMEYGQPLHAFDYDLLAENRIVVRRGRGGEQIVSIDETRCELNEDMLVIADAARPVAIAGVMGGLDSEISSRSTNILLESAQFDPLTTRKTARALSLMSESSYRFERGVDPVGVDLASLRACQLILQTAGGELAEGVVDVWAEPYRGPGVVMRTDRCRALLGVSVDDRTQAEILDRLGLQPKPADGRITCTIPPWRCDLQREVDLIEEVARLYGYDKIPEHDRVTHGVGGLTLIERVRSQIAGVLSAAGLDEAVTYTFVDDAEAALFGFSRGVRVDPKVRRTSNLLRPTLLPSLLAACKRNQDAGNPGVNLYELAAVFPPGAGELPDEYTQLAVVAQRDVPALRGVLEAVLARVSPAATLEVVPAAAPGLAEGAAAEVRLDGEAVGSLGMIAPAVLDAYGLEKPLAAATLRFEALLARGGEVRTCRPMPKFPPAARDLSVVVDDALPWADLAAVIGSVAEPMLESVAYVTTYRGKQIAKGKKSVTVSLTYRNPEGTFRSEEVDEKVGRVVAALADGLGATLRT